jgi:Cu/Ag efflux protein CusF
VNLMGRRTATIAVTSLLALTAGYSATRALVAVRPAPGVETQREARGFRFEVEDATVRKVDLADSRVELTSDLLGLFGARLQVTDRTEILLDGLQARLADLPEGARVRASYELQDGMKVARTISAEKPEPEPVPPPAVSR